MIPVTREAINLKINDISCEGTFYYLQNQDIRMNPPLLLNRESWLEFTIARDVAVEHPDSLEVLLSMGNGKVENVEDDGKSYEAIISEWRFDSVNNVYSGTMQMINKWYE